MADVRADLQQAHQDDTRAAAAAVVLQSRARGRAARRLRDEAVLIRELRNEHDEVRARVGDLERDPDTDLDTRLPVLGRLLETHVRKEERVLFQAMQRAMGPAEMDRLGLRLAGLRRQEVGCRLRSVKK